MLKPKRSVTYPFNGHLRAAYLGCDNGTENGHESAAQRLLHPNSEEQSHMESKLNPELSDCAESVRNAMDVFSEDSSG
jgi:hypothetical protein